MRMSAGMPLAVSASLLSFACLSAALPFETAAAASKYAPLTASATTEERRVTDNRARAVELPDYLAPALEILAFQFALNRSNRWFGEARDDYRVSLATIRRNSSGGWVTDRDPFNINQLGHPYQGAMYHGFARSAGQSFWPSLGYTFAGSLIWEIAGEATPPSRNDQMASGIGGSFLGEALYRIHGLILSGRAGLAPSVRRWAAAAASPSAAFDQWLFGRKPATEGDDAAYYSRVQLGYRRARENDDAAPGSQPIGRHAMQAEYSLDFGLPGDADYTYRRPFDHFIFDASVSTMSGVEDVMTRGLLFGRGYTLGGRNHGVLGLYGGFDYVAPQFFRVSTTALSLGNTLQWTLSPRWSMLTTTMAGVGYAAVGAPGAPDSQQRRYNYGVAPQALLALRLSYDDRTALDLRARGFFVTDIASQTGAGRDRITKLELALTQRLAGPHAVALKFIALGRDASFEAAHQSLRQRGYMVGLYYTLIGRGGFGAPEP